MDGLAEFPKPIRHHQGSKEASASRELGSYCGRPPSRVEAPMKAAPSAPYPSVPPAILVHFPRCLDGPTVHPRDPREPVAEGVRQGRE